MSAADQKIWSSIIGAAAEGGTGSTSDFLDAQAALSTPRRLMASVRGVMAALESPEKKLNRIVALVAKDLRADVCSCFILRAGEVLELFSSVGLPPEAVHTSKVRVGDGCVGDIAAGSLPVVLPDIAIHPQYAPRPETGNGSFKAFCGVPVLRGGRVRGVLAVQNRLPRAYGEETVEVLQTVAMVVAELIVAGGLISRLEISSGFPGGNKPNQIDAVSLGKGVAIGTAVLYEPGIDMQDIVSDDPAAQKMRLHRALMSMHAAIDSMLDRNSVLSGSESRDILEAYQMFARDRGWLQRIELTIDKGLSAEAAVQRVQNETRARMMQMSDAYIRERLYDLEDLSNRLLSHLIRQDKETALAELPDNMILVARSLGPAALLDYDHAKLKAVVLEKGSHSNHVAIVARALNIPVVGQCGDVCNFVGNGDQMIVDGDQGLVYINPQDYVLDLYTHSIEARVRRSSLHRRRTQQKCVTKDGVNVSVMINAGLLAEAGHVLSAGADGIGLFRSELSFMGWKKYPLVVTQAELYGKVIDQAGGKPVVFRTFDIGGDKPLPYFTPPAEEDNPALGWRAIRIGMDRPAVLRTQFRAFIRAANGRDLKIMLPFVSEVAEFDRARELLEMEKIRAPQFGVKVPEKIELGVMIEVPALLWQLGALLKTADFVSVGTNDLMQYLFAADRCNHAIRGRYDALSPAMLNVLKTIADQCRAAGRPLSVCGEMAGQPLEAMVLIALGYDTLSVPAQSVEMLRTLVPAIDTRVLKPYLEQLISSREHSVRERLASFARDHDVNVTQGV